MCQSVTERTHSSKRTHSMGQSVTEGTHSIERTHSMGHSVTERGSWANVSQGAHI